MKKISIIDYGAGNLLSVRNALKYLGHNCEITNDPKLIETSDFLILPGVGSFYKSMKKIDTLGISDAIKESILIKEKKILGICLGMQLLANLGTEDKEINGLGLINANVISMKNITKEKIPQEGFNRVKKEYKNGLYKGLKYVFLFHSLLFSRSEK